MAKKAIPLNPNDVRAARNEKATREAGPIIERVNESLKKGDLSRGVTFATDRLGEDAATREYVIAEFRRHGWNVEFTGDQRDGDFYTFKPNA